MPSDCNEDATGSVLHAGSYGDYLRKQEVDVLRQQLAALTLRVDEILTPTEEITILRNLCIDLERRIEALRIQVGLGRA